VGRLEQGERCLAFIDESPEALLAMEQIELVGRHGQVDFDADQGHHRVTFSSLS